MTHNIFFIPLEKYTNYISAALHLGAKVYKRGIKNKYLIIVGLRGYIERGEPIWEGVA